MENEPGPSAEGAEESSLPEGGGPGPGPLPSEDAVCTPEGRPEGDSLGRKKWLFVLVSLILLVAVFYKVGFAEVFEELRDIDPLVILLLALISFCSVLIDTLRWKIFTDALEKMPFRTVLPIYLAGRFANIITPGFKSGGEVVRSFYLTKVTGKTNAECLATIILDTLVIGLSFLVLIIFSLVYMQIYMEITYQARVLVVCIFAFLIGVVAFYLHHRRNKGSPEGKARFSRFLRWLYGFKFVKRRFVKLGRGTDFQCFEGFVHERIQHFKDTFYGLVGNRALFARAFSLSFIPILLIVLGSFILFRVKGEDVGFLTVLSVVSFAYFLAYFIPLPGGVGIVEGTMVGLYTVNNIDPSVAATVTLIDRGLFMLYGVGGGYFSLNYLGYKYHVKPGEGEEEEKEQGQQEDGGSGNADDAPPMVAPSEEE